MHANKVIRRENDEVTPRFTSATLQQKNLVECPKSKWCWQKLKNDIEQLLSRNG